MPEFRMGATVGGNRQGGPRWRALLVSLALVLIVASVPVAVWAIPARVPPSQAGDDAATPTAGETIADGRAKMPRGDIAWTVRRIDVPGGEGVAVEAFPVGFALVDAGTVALRAEDDEEPTELGEGEAAVLPDRKAGALASVEGATASLYEIDLVSTRDVESGEASGSVVGAPFAAPEGDAFDIELVGNTVSGDEAVTVPVSRSGAPVVFLTTEGTAQLEAADGQTVDLAAGRFAMLAGEVQVRSASGDPVTFVVAAIGQESAARDAGARAGRGDRQRVRDGAGRGEDTPRAGRTKEQRAPRVRTGGGGGGRRAERAQQGTGGAGGAPVSGGVNTTPPAGAPAGTPPGDVAPDATPPAVPTIPADGTPPVDATVPADGTPPAEATVPPTDETAPTATVPADESPTVPAVPTNPPVPPVPGVPTVPVEEPVEAESIPTEVVPAAEETLPVEEAPAPPVEEAPVVEPTAEG